MRKLTNTEKTIIYAIGLIIAFILMGNSNNIPEPFIQRIFKPISRENLTVHYGQLIVIIGIYCCLNGLNSIKESSLIKTGFRRTVVVIVLLSASPSLWNYCNIFYKGFSNDLNSIYLYREKTNVSIQGNDENVSVNGNIYIKNCSNNTQKFYIKLKVPAIAREDISEEYISIKNEFRVPPKEERHISLYEDVELERENKYFGYGANIFEYVLFNEKEEVVFKGTIEDYKYDNFDFENRYK